MTRYLIRVCWISEGVDPNVSTYLIGAAVLALAVALAIGDVDLGQLHSHDLSVVGRHEHGAPTPGLAAVNQKSFIKFI